MMSVDSKRQIDGRADQQAADALASCATKRALAGEVSLRRGEDRLRLGEVGARRDTAFEPRLGQADAALRDVGGLLRDLEQRVASAA